MNGVPADAAAGELLTCCGSREWARQMARARPFRDLPHLLRVAEDIWRKLPEADWREAFLAHPKIGGVATGREAEEQAGARGAPDSVRQELVHANREYEERFGRVFLVCASGKSGEEMLALCRERLHNDAETELRVTAEEQRKITRLRLERTFGP